MRKPDFENILLILNREKPKRPTLFEFFMNQKLYEEVSGIKDPEKIDMARIKTFEKLGYDYTTFHCSFVFQRNERAHDKSVSLNENPTISDKKSFEEYPWPDAEKFDYSKLEKIAPEIPDGMKLIVPGPGGVLENVISLVGFDNLCFMQLDEPELMKNICDAVGSRLLKHYEIVSAFDTVGALISNDDWGFKTQTMLGPALMREYIIPWHIKIAEAAHKAGKPVILHSCGNLAELMDDIVNVIKYDGKHSYEDNIKPVEEAYEELCGKIAVMGGIDLDFICRSTPEQVYERSKAMLKRSSERGAYALGSGNSIPEYVPVKNYYAMISAVKDS